VNAAERRQGAAIAGPLLVLAALALAWGCNWPFMKIVFAELPVWGFRAASGLVAGLALLAVARMRREPTMPAGARDWRFLAISAFLNVTVWQVTTAYGVQLLGSGHAAVLAFTMPLWSGLIAFVAFGERPGGLFVAALAMGMAGVGLLSFRGGGFAASDLPGMGLMFIAAIGWALGVQHGKRARHRPELPMLASTGWQLVLASIPVFLVWPLAEPVRWPEASAAAWLAAGYVTFVALIVGYISWFTLVKILPSHVASLSTLAVPATAMASGALALGEPLGPREAIALLLMLGALALVLVVPALLRGSAAARN